MPTDKVLSAESCSGGDTQQPAAVSFSQAAHQSINNPPSIHQSIPYQIPHQSSFNQNPLSFFSESFTYSGKQEVEQQFLGRGVTL
jgi:hypothetical protein